MYAPATWRLIISPPSHGAWNMAADEAILEAVTRGEAPPTLRLYAWQPPCLSLGHAQPWSDVDWKRLTAAGWDIVRRPTGGRAILHTDELTYAVIGPQEEPRLKGGVLESYRRLSQALLEALNLLSLQAQAKPITASDENGEAKGPVCFEVPSNYEITVNGKKLLGSAQARKQGGILQHGTLPLWGDLTRITQALHYESESQRERSAARLQERATTVEEILGHRPTWEAATRAFISAFKQELALELEPAELSAAEQGRAMELVSEKYGNPIWTERI